MHSVVSSLCCWFVVLFLFVCQVGSSQAVLYMEVMTETKPIKYYEGQILSFKSKEFSEKYQDVKITRIIDEEQLILYDGGMLKVSDITHVRRSRAWPHIIGYALQTFGAAWFVYGGIAHFSTDYKIGPDTIAIGAVALGGGWLIRKFFRNKKYKIGKKVRLKVLDLSWTDH